MRVEHDGEGLHPSEIASPSLRSTSDEVCVDLEVIIGDDSKVSSPCTVEVEHHAVTTNKPRIVAEGAISIAVWSSNCMVTSHLLLQSMKHPFCFLFFTGFRTLHWSGHTSVLPWQAPLAWQKALSFPEGDGGNIS